MRKDALGRQALENYTYDELLSRWEKAEAEPDRYVFDYVTGRLYKNQGGTWVNTNALEWLPDWRRRLPVIDAGSIEEIRDRTEQLNRPLLDQPQDTRTEEEKAAQSGEPVLPFLPM